jgi:hypothetical protein
MKSIFATLFGTLCLIQLIGWTTVLAADESQTTNTYVNNCLRSGFDPWQLSCSTCSILPESVRETCLSCCQSFKTLDKKARRYGGAILVSTGYPSSVEEFLKEDSEKILNQKAGLHIKNVDGGGGMFQFQARPSAILWYDNNDNLQDGVNSRSLESLFTNAVEVFTLDGLSRDDIREMFEALLPDRK